LTWLDQGLFRHWQPIPSPANLCPELGSVGPIARHVAAPFHPNEKPTMKKKKLVAGEWYYRCGYRSSNNMPTRPRIFIETVEFLGHFKRDPRSSTSYYTFDYVNPEAHESRGFQIASREQAEQSVLTAK
jgi:hypothetical protein